MSYEEENLKIGKSANARDHLANERTFLAWVRTSIGIMAFGFVVEKFALFIKEIALVLGTSHVATPHNTAPTVQGYSSLLGVALVAFGTLLSLLAYIQYKHVEREIENNMYRPSSSLNILLTLSVLCTGIFLILYLSQSI